MEPDQTPVDTQRTEQPETTPTDSTPTADVAELAAEIVAERPEVSAGADAMAAEVIARVPAEGEPIKRGRGRPRGSGRSTVKKPSKTAPSADPVELQRMTEARRQSAAVVVGMICGLCCAMIDGDEWKPSAEESATMTGAVDNYLASRNVADLPPGWTVVLAFAMYAAPRMARERTRGKLARAWAKVRGWFGNKSTEKEKAP